MVYQYRSIYRRRFLVQLHHWSTVRRYYPCITRSNSINKSDWCNAHFVIITRYQKWVQCLKCHQRIHINCTSNKKLMCTIIVFLIKMSFYNNIDLEIFNFCDTYAKPKRLIINKFVNYERTFYFFYNVTTIPLYCYNQP